MPISIINGFKIYDGLRKSLIIQPDRISEGMAFFLEHSLDGIAIEREHGYNLDNIDFLNDYPFIEHISISSDPLNIDGIYNLKNLTSLILSGRNRKLDFSCFTKLVELKADWSPYFVNLNACIKLKKLSFYNYNPKNKLYEELAKVSWLQILEITQSSIDTLEWLKGFDQLQDVSFNYCGKIKRLSSLEKSSNNLLKLIFDHCKSIENHDYVKQFPNLKILGYNHCGEIKSIGFIKEMPALEDFRFVNTIISDGDLSPCLGLKHAGFNNKKHYSHTSEQIEKMIKGN
jgi:hypothetical protein